MKRTIRLPLLASVLALLGGVGCQAGELVLAPGQPFTEQGLQELVRDALPGRASGHRVELRATRPMLPMNNPSSADVKLTLAGLRIGDDGQTFEAQVALKVTGGTSTLFKLVGTVDEQVEVPVIASSVAPGGALDPAQVEMDWVSKDRLPADVITEPGQLAGQEAVRRLQEGRFLRAADIRPLALVRRNDVVTVVYHTPSMEISMLARAVGDGAEGDVVRIRNEDSGREFKARVSGAKRVEVGGQGS